MATVKKSMKKAAPKKAMAAPMQAPPMGGGPMMKKGGKMAKAKDGSSFPDLNHDGKITKADILKGRGVIAKKGAKVAKVAKKAMPCASCGKSIKKK